MSKWIIWYYPWVFTDENKQVSQFFCDLRSSHLQVYNKKVVLKHFTNITGKNLWWSRLSIKLQAGGLTLLKRNSVSRAFIWILQRFLEHLFEKDHRPSISVFYNWNGISVRGWRIRYKITTCEHYLHYQIPRISFTVKTTLFLLNILCTF